jgi:hypothetical protein
MRASMRVEDDHYLTVHGCILHGSAIGRWGRARAVHGRNGVVFERHGCGLIILLMDLRISGSKDQRRL